MNFAVTSDIPVTQMFFAIIKIMGQSKTFDVWRHHATRANQHNQSRNQEDEPEPSIHNRVASLRKPTVGQY